LFLRELVAYGTVFSRKKGWVCLRCAGLAIDIGSTRQLDSNDTDGSIHVDQTFLPRHRHPERYRPGHGRSGRCVDLARAPSGPAPLSGVPRKRKPEGFGWRGCRWVRMLSF